MQILFVRNVYVCSSLSVLPPPSPRQAKKGFGSRTFDGKSVDASYFPEEQFAAKAFGSS